MRPLFTLFQLFLHGLAYSALPSHFPLPSWKVVFFRKWSLLFCMPWIVYFLICVLPPCNWNHNSTQASPHSWNLHSMDFSNKKFKESQKNRSQFKGRKKNQEKGWLKKMKARASKCQWMNASFPEKETTRCKWQPTNYWYYYYQLKISNTTGI